MTHFGCPPTQRAGGKDRKVDGVRRTKEFSDAGAPHVAGRQLPDVLSTFLKPSDFSQTLFLVTTRTSKLPS